MTAFDPTEIQVVSCDIFGTTVDWFTGVSEQAADVFRTAGVDLDAEAFTNQWRDMYRPAMQCVRDGERSWVYLDTLHRESLDHLLGRHNVGAALDEDARARLVRAWHLLPAWPDSIEGLARLRKRYTMAALSNGGFALLTRLVKAANLPFDCILSAEQARAYKPAPQVYRTAAGLLDVEPAQILMVVAHSLGHRRRPPGRPAHRLPRTPSRKGSRPQSRPRRRHPQRPDRHQLHRTRRKTGLLKAFETVRPFLEPAAVLRSNVGWYG
ncbi:haloacid dehalogenase type II [Nocardia sp. CA-128927]|uniref:haloacid dehalogenase type II n=1 Tax=Nocardia sp. CA-128927 TaxID=3239975 RepID=UPI003D95A9D4